MQRGLLLNTYRVSGNSIPPQGTLALIQGGGDIAQLRLLGDPDPPAYIKSRKAFLNGRVAAFSFLLFTLTYTHIGLTLESNREFCSPCCRQRWLRQKGRVTKTTRKGAGIALTPGLGGPSPVSPAHLSPRRTFFNEGSEDFSFQF